jgi:PAS domain S-box-containing protein
MSEPQNEKINILMVDDQPGKLLTYETILSELGENLIRATSGREALDQLLKQDISIVLMDVSMPELDGFELAEMIRQHPRFQKVSIIFISAVHLADLDRLKGYERGAVDYISVPINPELLRAKVSVFAELHRNRSQLETLNRELQQRVNERTEELSRKADVLEWLNAELAQKHRQLDAIVQTAPDIVFSAQADGALDYVSDRFYEYTGAPPGAAVGFNWLEYLHPNDAEQTRAYWMERIAAGENAEAEFRSRGKDGSYRWFRARAIAVRDDQGQIVKWYGISSDIHDSKLLAQAMHDRSVELERMVEERTAALRRLSGRLMSLQDEERRRIARDLHDGLGQDLIAVKMLLGDGFQPNDPGVTAASEVNEMIDHAIQKVRSISHLLHPPLLDEVGLVSALRCYLDGLAERSSISTILDVQPTEFPRLTPELETAVFRITQEALTNVYRHSQASRAWVSLRHSSGYLTLAVMDDGKGIIEQVADLEPRSIGVGIGSMRQRAREFGGEMRLTKANPGTLVEVVIPRPCEASVSATAS